jgi:hypothetical protein
MKEQKSKIDLRIALKAEEMKDFEKKKEVVKIDKNEYEKLIRKVQELD